MAELESKLTSLEDELEQMKMTAEHNDTELKVRKLMAIIIRVIELYYTLLARCLSPIVCE